MPDLRIAYVVLIAVGLAWAGVGGFLLLHSAGGTALNRVDKVAYGQKHEAMRVLGDPRTSGLREWPGQFDAHPTTFDLDGDGTDEVIAMSNDTKVYVFRADGLVLATLETHYPPGWYIERVLNTVEAGVLQPGEPPSIVVTDHAAYVTVWRLDPAHSNPRHLAFERMWEHRMDSCFWNPGMDAGPTLADLDGDGRLDITVQTEELGFFALRSDGTEMWHQCWAGGNCAPVVADLNGDGKPEVIVAADDGFVSVLAGASGDPQWTFDAKQYNVTPASISVSPVVADLDGQLPLEVLFTTRHVPSADPATFKDDHMAIFAVHQDPVTYQAALLWMRQPAWATPLSYTRLVVTDADGDGETDIFGMDWNTVGHEPGHWEDLGESHVFRLRADGSDVWVEKARSWWSNKDVALDDLDGDGTPELLVEGQRGGFSGMYALRIRDGDAGSFIPAGQAQSQPFAAWKAMRGPTIEHIHHDGRVQILYPALPDDGSTRRGAILLFEL